MKVLATTWRHETTNEVKITSDHLSTQVRDNHHPSAPQVACTTKDSRPLQCLSLPEINKNKTGYDGVFGCPRKFQPSRNVYYFKNVKSCTIWWSFTLLPKLRTTKNIEPQPWLTILHWLGHLHGLASLSCKLTQNVFIGSCGDLPKSKHLYKCKIFCHYI